MIKVGERIPEATFTVMTNDGPAQRTTGELCAGSKVAMFAVPGAFTPTCHMNHLPGFLGNAEALRSKGVDEIAVVAVNDVFVMNAWADATKGKGKITYLADGSGSFTRAAGMELDLGAHGLGTRSRRYAMLVDDGVIKVLNIEDNPGEAKSSTAEALLTDI